MSSQRGSSLSSFCLGRSSECKDVFLKIPLLDEVFVIHTKGLVLGSLMPFAIREIAVILLQDGQDRVSLASDASPIVDP